MIYLIAESKTMSGELRHVSEEYYLDHRPADEAHADEITAHLRSYTDAELRALLRLSPGLATASIGYINDFGAKGFGLSAVEAYTGVVFKALDYVSLPENAKERARSSMLIVSSLYGLLGPDDFIRPYRLDFDMPGAPDGKTLAAYWRKYNTLRLGKFLRGHPGEAVINLLPGAASKCFDWKLLKGLGTVRPIDFRIPTGPDNFKTPNATRLKQMRGLFLREALTAGIDTLPQLAGHDFDNFLRADSPMEGRELFVGDE